MSFALSQLDVNNVRVYLASYAFIVCYIPHFIVFILPYVHATDTFISTIASDLIILYNFKDFLPSIYQFSDPWLFFCLDSRFELSKLLKFFIF